MAHISEHTYSSNEKNHSYDQTRKMIFNIGSEKGKNNDNPSCQLTHLQNSLLISIVETTEEDVSNVDPKYDMRKVRTS